MDSSVSRVLLPISATSPDRTLDVTLSLCEGLGADLFLVRPLSVPEQTPLTVNEEQLKQERTVAEETLSTIRDEEPAVQLSGGVRIGHKLRSLISDAAIEHDVDLVVLDADTFSDDFGLGRSDVRRIARAATCDVLVISGPDTVEQVRTVLVPLSEGPHTGLAVDVARALAASDTIWVELFHVISPTASEADRQAARRLLEDAASEFDSDRVDRWLIESEDVAEAIIEQSKHYSLTVMGSPERSRLERFFFGSTTDSVISEASVPVVVAWRN